MNTISKDIIYNLISSIKDPELGIPIGELNMIKEINILDYEINVTILLTTEVCPLKDIIKDTIKNKIKNTLDNYEINILFNYMTKDELNKVKELINKRSSNSLNYLKDKKLYCIYSGKGGVGKSSISAHLAYELSKYTDKKVGLLDIDIYGHSITDIFKIDIKKHNINVIDNIIFPPIINKLKIFSYGMLNPDNQPLLYRGPMLHKALYKVMNTVFWGDDIDILIFDLPPGTGDIPISLGQLIPWSKIIIVYTPLDNVLRVTERASKISLHTKQEIIFSIENMSYIVCNHCHKKDKLFHGNNLSINNIPLLVSIPFIKDIQKSPFESNNRLFNSSVLDLLL